ncbi:PREDICTED: epsin-3 [Nelumbo nucifera]|uniref:ENTH domain-containing protein n=2 Tax=Nelumbo nucifera TaxID=4432 RepID=A0A822XIE3_NELNU|nr:PREDICTED: epsin-3 [Nelumbo nucifera]DAD19997.1 TPA_asm: hypothetical protein HUJ06_021460 [Nelumbo nucifera]
MENLSLDDIKKQASSFIQEKYKILRLALTDVTQPELLAEEATNNDPWGPDARTMTRIAQASYDIDDYWRIVDVLHRRFYAIDQKLWRQSYKSLILLEFLLTHGPEDFVEEFQCATEVIEELGTFKYVDERGFDWGINMQKKSERILELLGGGEALKEARHKALKITKEIKGFGNSVFPPDQSSSTSSSRTSSFGSHSSNSPRWYDLEELSPHEPLSPTKNLGESSSEGSRLPSEKPTTFPGANEDAEGSHLWNSPVEESGNSLLNPEKEAETDGVSGAVCSKFVGPSSPLNSDAKKVTLRSFSDVGKVVKKKIDRQLSIRSA